MADRPAIIVHDLAQARAALGAARDARCAVRLESAPGAAAQAGAAWFAAVIAEARRACRGARAEAVLDCGREAGLALGAIREGVDAIRTQARPAVRAKLRAIARAAGVGFHEGRLRGALDLAAHDDAASAAAAFLARKPARRRLQKAKPSAMSGPKPRRAPARR